MNSFLVVVKPEMTCT